MPPKDELTFNRFISMISRCSQVHFDRELAPLKIGAGQIRILRALDQGDGVSQERICHIFRLDKATVAKSIRPLIREGYVRREKNPADKRAYRIFLTEKGRDAMPQLKATVQNWADILTAGFTADEEAAVKVLLSRMAQNARDHLGGRPPARVAASSR